jgi:hypothetical protein
MKVEYPIHLFENFNKKIWTNKKFSYFLIIIIIGYTVILRRNPDIYYKYLFNPILLIIVIGCILLIARYNTPLGFMLAVSLIALYYPTSIHHQEITENFDDKIKIPIPGEDKNIVDDTKKNKKKVETDSDAEDDDEDDEDDAEDDEEEETKDKTKKKGKKLTEKFKDDDEVKDIGLEKLNPAYYKSNNSKNSKNSKKSKTNTKSILDKDKDTDTDTDKKNDKNDSLNKLTKSTNKPVKNESFIGDVRNIIQDLDTGKKGMNASNAIKQINNLFYNKHKHNIQKIIAEDNDDESEDDDDFF